MEKIAQIVDLKYFQFKMTKYANCNVVKSKRKDR